MPVVPIRFQERNSVLPLADRAGLAAKFDEHGLITAVTSAAGSGELIMQGFANDAALRRTIATGEAHHYSNR